MKYKLQRVDHIHLGGSTPIDVRYLLGAGALAFTFEIPHGMGKRRVQFSITPEKLIQFADLFRGVPDDKRGHAYYHFERGDGPCDQCDPALRRNLEEIRRPGRKDEKL
jgi:hypothetical protein